MDKTTFLKKLNDLLKNKFSTTNVELLLDELKELLKHYQPNETNCLPTYRELLHLKLDIARAFKTAFVKEQEKPLAPLLQSQMLGYIEIEVKIFHDFYCKHGLSSTETEVKKTKSLNWTESKSALVELIYALKYTSSINHGKATLKDITDCFSASLNVKIPHLHATLNKISERKGRDVQHKRSFFLNELTDRFNQRLEEADL